MHVVHDLPGRIRLRAASSFDVRLHAEFLDLLPDRIPGVTDVRVSLRARSLIVRYDGSRGTRGALLRHIAGTPPSLRRRPLRTETADRSLRKTLIAGAVLAAGPFLPPAVRGFLALAITAPTVIKGVEAVIEKGVCVEALDAIAMSIAVARGSFGTAAATMTLLHLGEYLEATTAQSSTDLLRRLIARPSGVAWREQPDGSLITVPTGSLHEDEIVVVGPGDAIPVDGQIVSGAATVNEASITGEGVPTDRETGAQVLAGGVVEEGRLRVRAVRVGDATTTARIAAFIEQALQRKPAIQSSAERLADRRILYTLGLGAVTLAVTRDVDRLASVFLIDYSCALKLGVPVAVKSALYQAASDGVLIKGGGAVEALAEIDTLVFDKTGTLTHGELEVTDVIPVGKSWNAKRMLATLASLEEHANHPVAEAIVQEARRKTLDHVHHDDVDFIVAHGLISEVEGRRIVVGSRHFLEEHENIPFHSFRALSERLTESGNILLFAAVDGEPAGAVGLRDHLRPEARDTVRRLRELGIRDLVMLTGDRKAKAKALATELGLDRVYAEMRPEDKASIVRALQSEGRKVAFVGDGVNDAPALVAADVGIAMPRGADLARATADVVLLKDDLAGVAASRALATETIRLIRSNFRWAAALNTILFASAVGGFASPVVSAVLHNGVTVGTLVRAVIGPRRKRQHLAP